MSNEIKQLSRVEIKRLVKQGAVEIDGVKITDHIIPASQLKDGSIIRVGKRRFIKLVNADNIKEERCIK